MYCNFSWKRGIHLINRSWRSDVPPYHYNQLSWMLSKNWYFSGIFLYSVLCIWPLFTQWTLWETSKTADYSDKENITSPRSIYWMNPPFLRKVTICDCQYIVPFSKKGYNILYLYLDTFHAVIILKTTIFKMEKWDKIYFLESHPFPHASLLVPC